MTTLIIVVSIIVLIISFSLYRKSEMLKRVKEEELKSIIESKKAEIWKERNSNANDNMVKETTMANYLGIEVSDFRTCIGLYNLVKGGQHEEANQARIGLDKKLNKLGVSENAFKRVVENYG
jgi:hypothetical protein